MRTPSLTKRKHVPKKQGRVHGNPVADGRTGAEMRKLLAILRCYKGTDRRTDWPTDRHCTWFSIPDDIAYIRTSAHRSLWFYRAALRPPFKFLKMDCENGMPETFEWNISAHHHLICNSGLHGSEAVRVIPIFPFFLTLLISLFTK